MSDAHNEHESGIRTPKQLIAVVVASFLVPIVCIVLLVQYVVSDNKVGAGSNGQTPEAITARIKPIADEGYSFKDVNAPRVLLAGADVYKSTCLACHGAGVAGAPKVGDAATWSARIAQGYDTLVKHAIEGLRAMPPRGGNPDLDDYEVARAVVYMANESGAKFKEPEVKVTVAAAAPAAGTDAAPQGTAVAAGALAQAVPAASGATAPAATAPPSTTSASAAPAPAPVVPAPATTVAATAATAPAAGTDVGKKLYDTACFACHGAGIAGAPKFGDKTAWADRIKQGIDVLHTHAISGYQGKAGMMPPKGGSAASDADVKAAVDYMVAAAK